MLGFLLLMSILGALIGLGSYWMSWEMQDSRTRPRFSAKLCNDCAQLFRRSPSIPVSPESRPATPRAS